MKNFYRSDIDGLRSLAILPVILFHANLFFPGGFVGVDVFFVISGYLITRIIEREQGTRSYSIIGFYDRRVRRIFPALFVMFAVSCLVAYLILLPDELKDFGKSLAASSAFSSNVMFFRQSGYFAPNAEFIPLLHTWTLSVEEQFYVGWPLLLGLLSVPMFAKWKAPVSVGIVIGSLALSAYWVSTRPNAAFYLLPTRAWELVLGAFLCLAPISTALQRLSRPVAAVASIIGIGMVLVAELTYAKTTPFPGIAALLPCTGAALVIAAGEGGPSLGGRVLSFRPLVWVGLISYSLYLWHWPVLVFGALIANHQWDVAGRWGLIALTFLLAWVSWRFVERPFRSAGAFGWGSRTWVIAGLCASAVFVALGAFLFLSNGAPWRGRDVGQFVRETAAEEKRFQESPCLARGASLPKTESCLLGARSPASAYQVVLWGDSQAAHLAPVLDRVGQRLGMSVRQVAKAGCGPVPGVRFLPVTEFSVECPAFNDAALKAVLEDKSVRVVVLAAGWDRLADGSELLTFNGTRPTAKESQGRFASSLKVLLTTLVQSGRQVILVGQVPLPPANIVDCFARAQFRGLEPGHCAQTQSRSRSVTAYPDRPLRETEALVNQALSTAALGLSDSVKIVRPYNMLCPASSCRIESEGRLIYMDNNHLSSAGANLLAVDLEVALSHAQVSAVPPE